LIPGKFFRGNKDNQFFLNYALLNLIGYCPESANVDCSINKKNIFGLQIKYPNWCEMTQKYNLLSDLRKFPIGITNLSNLKNINFSECGLEDIPREIGNLNKLEDLNLSSNKIKYLPIEFGKLIGLKKLFLDDNDIKAIPLSLSKLVNLENNGGLWISGMPNLIIPDEIEHFVNTKINACYDFQLILINWSVKMNIVSKSSDSQGDDNFIFKDFEFFSPEDLEESEDEIYDNKWNALCHEIIINKKCPFQILIKFVDSDGYYDVNVLIHDETKKILMSHPTLINGLTNAGFGILKNPKTGNTVGRLTNGVLNPND